MNVRKLFFDLNDSLQRERGVALDVWRWLPSYEVARQLHADSPPMWKAIKAEKTVLDVLKEVERLLPHVSIGAEVYRGHYDAATLVEHFGCSCDLHQGNEAYERRQVALILDWFQRNYGVGFSRVAVEEEGSD